MRRVAALFAAPPVECGTVAWLAERKEMILSGLPSGLTLAAYSGATLRLPSRRAAMCCCCHVLPSWGLCIAKQMLVTLPFVLLLLDYWPLGKRATAGPASEDDRGMPLHGSFSLAGVLVEKVPLAAAMAASSYTCDHFGRNLGY